MNLYRIYDNKTEAWGDPVSIQTDAAAIREFKKLANDQEQPIGRDPADFSLWFVGRTKPDDPKIDNETIAFCLIQAIQLKDGN
ncbi:MAG: nonstructural protein [Microvirus sp.]|nr:MAG: nonstructural protein [Microvirus sp.]